MIQISDEPISVNFQHPPPAGSLDFSTAPILSPWITCAGADRISVGVRPFVGAAASASVYFLWSDDKTGGHTAPDASVLLAAIGATQTTITPGATVYKVPAGALNHLHRFPVAAHYFRIQVTAELAPAAGNGIEFWIERMAPA